MLTRRWFFKIMGLTGCLLLAWRGTLLGMLFARPKEKRLPFRPDNLFTEGGCSLVGVAGGEPKEAVARAVALIGGWDRLGLRGKKVLVKPNVVSAKPHPVTTSPEVVRAVVELLYQAGAGEVLVGDMSALLTLATSSTMRNMGKNGIRQAAAEAGARVVGFEEFAWVEVPLSGARYLEKALVTEWLYRVDLVVNLPVIKTHRSAGYSICLKNFIGCTHLRQRPYLVDADHWEELVAEFNLAFGPALHIVDGTVAMVQGGPWEGTPAPTGLVIASGDPIAADLVGLGIIRAHGLWAPVTGRNAWEQRQIRRALELDLGRTRERIRLLTAGGDAAFADLMDRVRDHAGL